MNEFLTSAVFYLGPPLLLAGLFTLLIDFIIRRQRGQRRYSPLTEDMQRMPAEHLEKKLDELDEPLLFGCMLVFLPGLGVSLTVRTNGYLWIGVGLVALYGAYKVWTTLHRVIRLRLAIDGERYTGQELNLLMRQGAWVYHDIPYAYGNIDHIVISTGGVFAVETKTYRKPAGERETSRLSKVSFDGQALVFPRSTTSEPIEQARRHAKYLQQSIRKDLGIAVPVTPTVALPGWFVERTARSDVWVINPRRGTALQSQVNRKVIAPQDAERIANYIESVSRSVRAGSKKMDPDATRYYERSGERKRQDRRLGD